MVRKGELWAITCVFSPFPSQQRIRNFHFFRERLNIPLVVAELGFDGRFATRHGDAEIVLHFEDGDKLWQKERLLNLAVKHVPSHCQKVVFLDADVLMSNPGWSEQTCALLDQYEVVQPFTDAVFMSLSAAGNYNPATDRHKYRATPAFSKLLPRISPTCAPGGAWAFQRSFIERYGLYDACIVGGGDTALAAALANKLDHFVNVATRTSSQANHYTAWAAQVGRATRGRIGHIADNDLIVIDHGTVANRQYMQRHGILLKHQFDPTLDLVDSFDGCWKWVGNKPQLAADVLEYFRTRQEDNPQAPPVKPVRPFLSGRKQRKKPFLNR